MASKRRTLSDFTTEADLIEWTLAAPDHEVGPACMNAPVPLTIADDLEFREIYGQGWHHALAAVRHLPSKRCEPVGELEIADRLGVKRQTVSQWRWRGLLPQPRWTVSGQPAWDWADVEAWARSSGRLS